VEESGPGANRASRFGFVSIVLAGPFPWESRVGGIDSELPFLFILIIYKAQRSKGTQAWIFLFLKIDVGEILFISLEEEIVESVDQGPDFPRGLDFLSGFHLFSFPC
jgi:hypothetical protein